MFGSTKWLREVAVRAVHGSSNENERDHDGRCRRKRQNMDIQEVARRQNVGCRSGDPREGIVTEFELKTAADAVITELVDRPQATLALVMPFWVRHKDIVQFGYTPGCRGCRAARANSR